MSSPVEKLTDIFTDYNALITKAKNQHKEIDIRIMQTSLLGIRGEQRQRGIPSEIQSQINEIKETREDEFDNPEDQARLRDLKLKIEELVREVFLEDRKRGREAESSQEPPLKMHVPSRVQSEKIGKRKREVESVESIKKQKPFDIIFAKYCEETPKDDAQVRAILRDINDGGRKKAFLLIPSDEHFTLYVLENGEIKSKLLSVDDSGQCTLYSDLRQESAAEKFKSFDEMKKSLGAFGLDARSSIENEKAIMAKYGVNFEPDKTALEIACSSLNKDLIKELLDNGSEIDTAMLQKCCDVVEAAYSDHQEGCEKILIEYAVDNGISLNSVIKERFGIGDTTLYSKLLQFEDGKFIEDMIVKSIEKYPESLLQDKEGDTPLHWAIDKDNKEFAKLLIAKNVGLSLQGKKERTPLHLAIKKGYTELAKLLIDKNAELLLQDKNENTPLHLSIKRGHTELAKLLIAKGAVLSSQDRYGKTPFHLAIFKGNTELVQLLIDKKDAGLLSVQDNGGHTPLHEAIATDNTELAKFLIDKNAGLACQTNSGETPLHLAIKKGYTELAELLIEKGVGLDVRNNEGYTPLHVAISEGNTEIAKLLIKKEVGLDVQNSRGYTPLRVAMDKDNIELAQLLIEKGVGLDVRNNEGYTPLHMAMDKNNIELSKLLIKKNIGLSLEDEKGYTPLHFAIYKGNIELVQLLKDAGVSIQTNKGPTQLHWAIERGNTELAKRLVAEDAGLLSLQNNMGDTPLHLAINKGNTEIAKLLIKKGVGLDVQNKKGYTPLHVAMNINNIELAKLLIEKNIGLSLQNEDGWSPLHLAIAIGNTELAELLIAKDAGLDFKSTIGNNQWVRN